MSTLGAFHPVSSVITPRHPSFMSSMFNTHHISAKSCFLCAYIAFVTSLLCCYFFNVQYSPHFGKILLLVCIYSFCTHHYYVVSLNVDLCFDHSTVLSICCPPISTLLSMHTMCHPTSILVNNLTSTIWQSFL